MFVAHISEDGRIQTCQDHSRHTAELAGRSLESIGLYGTAYLAGLLHDAGKFTEEFTAYIEKAVLGEARRGSIIHSFAGGAYILNRFHGKQKGMISIQDLTAELIACAIFSHHGLVDLISDNGDCGYEHRKTRQPEYDQCALNAFLQECASEKEIDTMFKQSVQEISEMLQRFPETENYSENCFYSGFLERLITSAVVAGDREDTSSFMLGTDSEQRTGSDDEIWEKTILNLNRFLDTFPKEGRLQLARRSFSDRCCEFASHPTGIYRLDLPTGSGKTLCTLRFSLNHAKTHRKKRIIYAAPLLSIIEQNADVIRNAVGDESLILEHHSNLAVPEEGDELKRAELLQESWEAPIIVTTMVRLLEILFSGQMTDVRRMQALCDSVLILDEVQSIPPKMLSMFNCAMNFLSNCCHTTVVLCSATQPPFDQARRGLKISHERMADHSLLDRFAPLFKRTEIQFGGAMKTAELPLYIKEMRENGNSLLVVCNTKSEASDLFHLLSDSMDNIYHLSAGMCMNHRKKILRELTAELQRKTPLICISTQVIEAGIDISFDTVIRMSAGLDSIVQCAGRCNRNGEHDEPRPVRIVLHTDQKLGPLNEIAAQQNALNDLIAQYHTDPDVFRHDLASDEAVEYYYKSLFRNMKDDTQDYPTNHLTLFSLLGDNKEYCALNPKYGTYGLNQAFKKAAGLFSVFDENNMSVLVPYEEGAKLIEALQTDRAKYDIGYCKQILTEAKGYSVTVSEKQLNQLRETGMVREILDGSVFIADAGIYDDKTGMLSGKKIKEKMEQCNTLIL